MNALHTLQFASTPKFTDAPAARLSVGAATLPTLATARRRPQATVTPAAATGLSAASRPATPCTLVSLLINQHSGTPFFPELFPELEGYLPAEQALWAVGAQGEDHRGRPFARTGLYALNRGTPQLVFHADLDLRSPDGGTLRLERRGGAAHVAPAKLAALNWTVGALFGTTEAGAFDLDPSALAALLKEGTERKEYAFARCVHANADLFGRHCQPLGRAAGDDTLVTPTIVPLLGRPRLGLLPGDPRPQEAIDALPVTPFTLTPPALRTLALNRFALGLRRTEGGFRTVKNQFGRHFDVAQELRDSGAHQMARRQQLDRALESTKRAALTHLAAVRLPEGERPGAMVDLVAALECLRVFIENRDEEGRVVLYAPGEPKAAWGRSALEIKTQRELLFAKPLASVVSGYPVQILRGVRHNGHFPQDGRQLANELA